MIVRERITRRIIWDETITNGLLAVVFVGIVALALLVIGVAVR